MDKEKPYVSKEDYERLMTQGKREDMERLFEYAILEFEKEKKAEGKIKVKDEYAKAYNPNIKKEKIPIPTPNDFLDELETKDGKKKKVVNRNRVVDYLLKKHNLLTIYGKSSEKVFVYRNGKWIEEGETIIKTQTEKLLDKKCTNHIVREVIGKIKRKTKADNNIFEQNNLYKIPLENGVYNVKEKKLEEHKPNNYFKFKIPIKYDEKAKCPKFKAFLKEILYPEDVPVIQEFFGFTLFRKYFIKKALIGQGEKDTSKTTLVEILVDWIGKENISGVPLQKVSGGNDFVKLSMKDKHLNFYDDLSSQDLKDGGSFKVVTGGGHISAEEKFGDYVQYKNFAKQLFMCNKIPPVKDNDDMAYFSRWIVIKFDNVVPKKEQNPFLVDQISKEKSGILNWALEGLERLLEKNKFSYDKTPEEVKEIMEYFGDPLSAFVQDVLIEDQGNKITKEEMYEIYSEWAKRNKRPRKTKHQLGRNLDRFADYITAKRQGSKRYWENVNLNKNNDIYDTFKNILSGNDSQRKKGDVQTTYKIFSKPSLSSQNTLKKDNSYQKYTKEELDQASPEFKEMLKDKK